jgi:autophagy-related protein 13
LSLWKTCGGFQNRPPPLILETYLDTSNLTSSQSLVIVDDQGKRWDVLEALNNSSGSNEGGSRLRKRNNEVILERWRIELKDGPGERTYDFGSTLPTVYKKCIVFFRSLYSTAKFVPAWKFVKGLAKSGSANSLLRVKCRILAGNIQPSRFDALTYPLYENGGSVTTEYFLGTTDTPVGQFSAEVSYRNDCSFRVDDSEALLSSRFMGADEHFFQPSLGVKGEDRRGASKAVEVGSLPAHRQRSEDTEPIQAYGSLSTFHGDAPPRGSSPISALRAAKTFGSDTSSPPVGSSPRSRPMRTSRASLRSLEGMARRPSVSFQPFKAGSLSSSPGRGTSLPKPGDMLPPQSPQSLPRPSGISALAQARNRSSLTAGMPASLRGAPIVPDNVVTSSASSSPKPAPISRYSSSFTHRRGRSSFGGTSKLVDDDQGSSGKQSLSSSAQPGSGILAEAGTGASSGSLQTDDDNISEFLKLLDSKKTLQSFEPSGEASTKRTSAQLSKFQSMRESNNALTESMSSSTMLHRSSSSSSRQLSSVPPMVAATSMSASSSPGKPISPHTPHTPAIPSRLSANSIAEYTEPRRLSHRSRASTDARLEDVADDDQTNGLGTNAIDIPTSPRPYYPHARRSSSVAQQHRSLAVEDDLGELPFGIHRSISLGADDREPPSLSALLGIGQTSEDVVSRSSPSPSRLLQPPAHITEGSAPMSRQESLEAHESEPPQTSRGLSAGSTNSPYRPRLGRMGGRGVTPPQTGSYSSLVERASGSGTSERAGGRHSFTRNSGAYEADDEPLLFDMSEIGRDHSRRSLEEPRGGGSAGGSVVDRGYDASRGCDSGSSSRRGSRRGW